MNQGKQPALIINEKHSNKNPNSSSTGVILKPIDEDNNEEKYGPKIPDPLAQRVEGKWKTKVAPEKVKEKSQNLQTPENCMKLSVPLTNKKIWNQLNIFQKNQTFGS